MVKLPREPGCREQRWAHLFSGEIDISQTEVEPRPEPARLVVQAENERITALRSQVDQILSEFAAFRQQLEQCARKRSGIYKTGNFKDQELCEVN